jgi:hypothetical protein
LTASVDGSGERLLVSYKAIWEQPVAGSAPKPVTHLTSDWIFWVDWSRDGRPALSRGTDSTDAVLIKNFR